MKFAFIAKHWGIRPAVWMCGTLGVSRSGFHAWLTRPRSGRSRGDEDLGAKVRASLLARDRTYGARRVWHDMIEDGISGGAVSDRKPDAAARAQGAIAPNLLDRAFEASAPNRKWIADFTYIWTAEG